MTFAEAAYTAKYHQGVSILHNALAEITPICKYELDL